MDHHLYIVDDNDGFRSFVKRVAEGVGWSVTECPNGQVLLDKVEGGTGPGLILLDISMPEMDGIETVLRLSDLGQALQICFVTGGPSVHAMTARLLLENKGNGVKHILTKPISVNELLCVLDNERCSSTNNQSERSTVETRRCV